jgi:hypothetical protein
MKRAHDTRHALLRLVSGAALALVSAAGCDDSGGAKADAADARRDASGADNTPAGDGAVDQTPGGSQADGPASDTPGGAADGAATSDGKPPDAGATPDADAPGTSPDADAPGTSPDAEGDGPSGGADGAAAGVYGARWISGGLDRLVITRWDPERRLCFRLRLASPSGPSAVALELPARWGVESAGVTTGASNCEVGLPIPEPSLHAVSGSGRVRWTGFVPCTIEAVDVELSFSSPPAGVSPRERLMKTSVPATPCAPP